MESEFQKVNGVLSDDDLRQRIERHERCAKLFYSIGNCEGPAMLMVSTTNCPITGDWVDGVVAAGSEDHKPFLQFCNDRGDYHYAKKLLYQDELGRRNVPVAGNRSQIAAHA